MEIDLRQAFGKLGELWRILSATFLKGPPEQIVDDVDDDEEVSSSSELASLSNYLAG